MFKNSIVNFLNQFGYAIHRSDTVGNLTKKIGPLENTLSDMGRENEKLKEELDRLQNNNLHQKGKITGKEGAGHATKLIMVACMPKSGSTFLTKLVSGMTDFPIYPFYSNGGAQELDVLAINALQTKYQGVVSHQHLISSDCAVSIINDYDITVIIMERNLLDIIVSARDALITKESIEEIKESDGLDNRLSFFLDSSYMKLSEKEQYDFVIDLTIPWYLKFFVSWGKYQSHLKSPPLWLSYESLFSDLHGSMEKIKTHCGLSGAFVDFENVISGVRDTRFNVGTTGRGLDILTQQQIEKVEKLIRHYPDFAKELIQWAPVS